MHRLLVETEQLEAASPVLPAEALRHLRLAAPNLQNSWDEGERLAVHATDIMNAREEFATFEEAVADCVAVVGTTAREGLYRQHVKAPRDCAADILSIAETGPVADSAPSP